MKVAQKLARYVRSFRFEDLPPDIIHQSKRVLPHQSRQRSVHKRQQRRLVRVASRQRPASFLKQLRK